MPFPYFTQDVRKRPPFKELKINISSKAHEKTHTKHVNYAAPNSNVSVTSIAPHLFYEVYEWQARIFTLQEIGIHTSRYEDHIRLWQKILHERQPLNAIYYDMDLISYQLFTKIITLDEVLNCRLDLNRKTSSGLTLMHLAVLMGDENMIDIIDKDSTTNSHIGVWNAEQQEKQIWMPIHLAVALASINNIYFDKFKKFIKNYAAIDYESANYPNLLTIAANYDSSDLCRFLIIHGAKITPRMYQNYIDEYGEGDNDEVLDILKHYSEFELPKFMGIKASAGFDLNYPTHELYKDAVRELSISLILADLQRIDKLISEGESESLGLVEKCEDWIF